jgi:riboflavin kinase/FMN adenylyltransferase
MEAAAFAYEVLVDRLHAAEVVVGRNFTFGHKALGDVAMLAELGGRFGFGVEGLDLMTDDGVTVSSTYIRSCIDAGDVAAAAAALGRPHRIEGVVVHGDHRGRELGFPTANIASAAWAALPADGVYAGHFVLGERRLPSAISVGTNPTFSGRERTVEVYVLDVDEDFYGFDVGVDIEHWLRGQERFTDIDALLVQIRADVDRTRALLGS